MTPEELLALDKMPTPAPKSGPVPKAAGEWTPEDIEALNDSAAVAIQAPAAAQPAVASSSGMTPEQVLALDAGQPAAAQAQPAGRPSSAMGTHAPGAKPAPEPGITDPLSTLDAVVTGGTKSIYETKDFIFGKPAEADKSDMRRGIEALDRRLTEGSIGNSFVSGLSQFATGMLGAGKLIGMAKAVPGVGGAIGAVEASRKGSVVLSSGKAAAVGAVAFDPHGPRMSDLVVLHGPSWLQNPVSSYLSRSGNEDDTAALGRMKNALESIGTDAALAGVFALSVKGYGALKAYRAGTGTAGQVEAATAELSQAVALKDAKLAASRGDLESLEALRLENPQAVAEAEVQFGMGRPVDPAQTTTPTTIRPDGTAEATLPEISVGKPTEVAPSEAGPTLPMVRATEGEAVSGPAVVGIEPAPGAAPAPNLLGITDDQVQRLITHGRADTEQLMAPGGWDAALERGYTFGDGGRVPWQKFALEPNAAPGTSQLDQVIRRVSDEFAGEIAAAKGGDGLTGVRSDAMQERLISQRAAIYGDDPAALMGSLQLAGRNADRLVADVAAADLITLRAAQDAQNLADRIRLGMLEEYGGDLSAAMSALRGHYQVAATARAESASMVANAARTLRRQRAEFAYTPEDVAAMSNLSDTQMLTLIEAAGRDPRVADRLLRRGFWSRVVDDASYLYVNNLLWSLRTHAVNLTTNLYMLGARPLERMIGAAVMGDRARIAENAKQYAYLGSSLHEAWQDAVRTWQTGDSILAPRTAELNAASAGRSVNWVAEGYKQADTVPNVLSNAYVGFMKAAGLPTRALGAVDELVKQTVYRSKVMAAAHGEGVQAGLEGPALSEHVQRTLDAAFDDGGRAVDLKALEEAHIATFQQDLLPNTVGSGVQNLVGNVPALRFVLPFIRTPTNVLRMGWKMTPGLNLAQTEFRSMIRGEMGQEAQAQAIGQAAMGSLFMGLAGFLTHAGYVTGGGPSDPKLKRDLMATGWQPYSFVVPGEAGPTFVNFGRFDPIAMSFGIMADVVDILERDHDGDGFGEQATAALGGVFLSLVKQLGQKTYLASLNDTLTALVSPERGLEKAAGKTVANFVPFASGLRFVNPDPLMREARSIVDSIKATVPGLSERLPPRRDVFGDPLTVHKGLWVHGKDGIVDAEVRRMIDEAGIGSVGAPSYELKGVDLRDVTTKDGRNAFDAYQQLAGHPPRGRSLKETLGKIMSTSAYQRAPDGDPAVVGGQKGTKQAMLLGTIAKYREVAGRMMLADPNVRQAVYQQRMKGNAAVAARSGPKTDKQEGATVLSQVGKRYGVELGGLLTGE